MNRIYQGRVTKVQMPAPASAGQQVGRKKEKRAEKTDWIDLPDGEAALWRHHEVFQDAVNYYTLALVTLGDELPETHPFRKLRERMRQAWDEFPKRTPTSAITLGQSLRKWLGIDAKASLDDACRKIVEPEKVSAALASQTAALLADDLSKTSDLGQYGRSAAPRYVKPSYEGNFRDESNRKALEAVEFRLAVHGVVQRPLVEFGALSLATESQRENRGSKAGEEARETLLKHVKKLKKESLLKDDVAHDLTAQIKKLATDALLVIPAYEAGGDSKEKSLGIPALLLGKQLGFGKAIMRCLTATIPRPADNWQKGLDEAQAAVKRGEDPLRMARGERGFVFLAFTALPAWSDAADGKPVWIEFDIAAFKEALMTINQFNEKTKEREEKKIEVKAELDFMLGRNESWKPKTSTEEDDREMPVLAGDPRYEMLLALLRDMDEDRSVHALEEIIGPTQSALRGFGKLRATWMDLMREELDLPAESVLQQAVTDLQREHKLDMGHTDFFLKLCEKGNWDIWRDASDGEAADQLAHGWAKNVVYAAADAQELADEWKRLQESIRYTPAEPRYSRRLFMFSDIKNAEGINHVSPGIVEVCVAAENDRGLLEPRRLCLGYGAPRMVRDQLMGGGSSQWLQPMMKAMGLDDENHTVLKKEPAVELMPDWVGRKRYLHFLLNFPVDIATDKLVAMVGKEARWQKQMNSKWKDGKLKQRYHILWDETQVEDKQKPDQWWWDDENIQREGFTCLSIDLGQRRAADYALLHSTPFEMEGSFVRIGDAGGKVWHTRLWSHRNPDQPGQAVSGLGSLRLPGEDAEVFYRGKAERELSGKKGRLADDDDYTEARALAEKLLHTGEKAEAWVGTCAADNSFPEQNDKLVRLFLGALSRYRTWHRWSWQLRPEHADRWDRVFKKEIAKLPYFAEWRAIAEKEVIPANALALQMQVAEKARELRIFLEEALIKIAGRVIPLRSNTWRWVECGSDPAGKPLHQLLSDGDKPDERPWVRGQRGLSLKRIEQLETFRRGVLSLNRLMRHRPGEKPDFGAETRGETLPDPCAVLTDKIVRMKEERVNQTAHLILAVALGVRLKAPGADDKLRVEQNIHGEYEPIPGRKPVDFIVLEDLSRYTTDKSRARAENSRLMKWCHRAINEKVKMLAEPFGIPVVEVFASFTSKFDARTGAPGFRAGEVSMQERAQWNKAVEKEPRIAAVFAQLEAAAGKGVKHPRLLIPQQLGEFFIAAKQVKIGDDPKTFPKIRQADINAAVNIGLRAIGGPNCFHAHPRVRVEREGSKGKGSKGKRGRTSDNQPASGKWLTRRENKREKAQFGSAKEISFMKLSEDSALLKESKTTLMHDPFGIASYGHASIQECDHPPLAHNAAIFSRRKNELGQFNGAVARLEWDICEAINAARIQAWEEAGG